MPKINKRQIVSRLITQPKDKKRAFWAREMKILNSLLEEFTDLGFWEKVKFNKMYDSLAYFIHPFGKKYLITKYNEYNYKIPQTKKVDLGKKIGEDKKIIKTKKTIKDFLNE